MFLSQPGQMYCCLLTHLPPSCWMCVNEEWVCVCVCKGVECVFPWQWAKFSLPTEKACSVILFYEFACGTAGQHSGAFMQGNILQNYGTKGNELPRKYVNIQMVLFLCLHVLFNNHIGFVCVLVTAESNWVKLLNVRSIYCSSREMKTRHWY